MLYFMLGGSLFYYKTVIFVQFLLFYVMVFHLPQYWSIKLAIFACLTLPQSLGKMRRCDT